MPFPKWFEFDVTVLDESAPPFDLYIRNANGVIGKVSSADKPLASSERMQFMTEDSPCMVSARVHEALTDYIYQRLDSILSREEVPAESKAVALSLSHRPVMKPLFESPEDLSHLPAVRNHVDRIINRLQENPEFLDILLAPSTPETYFLAHAHNVATLNIVIAMKIFTDRHEVLREVGLAGMFSDIGYTSIDMSLLARKGKLTNEEFAEIKSHVIASERIMTAYGFDLGMRQTGRYHHEHFDGSGYPEGLKREAIPFYARITAVSDVYDAMTSERYHHRNEAHLEVLQEMARKKGWFDDKVFHALLTLVLTDKNLVAKFIGSYLME
jgi:HD-GYP domain-containing protein (c-di-GMP phosphodiesterase class II)